MKSRLQSRRASVVLLALCFVAVLGISLSTYLALASRGMQLSNRSVKQGQAQQLAELGIEEGLRAMNLNLFNSADTTAALADWSSNGTSVDWTVDTTNKRARAAISFPADKFGPGITASVKVRVDNYDAGSLDATWNSSATYLPGNFVGRNGRWYLANTNQSGKTPSTASGYWSQEQSWATVSNVPGNMVWISGTTYQVGTIIIRNGAHYRCISGHMASSSNRPPNITYWLSIPYITFNSDLQYSTDSMVYWSSGWTWYRYTSSGSWLTTGTGMPPRWYYSSSTTYYPGDMVQSNSSNTWYRYINSSASSGAALTNLSYWSLASGITTSAAANWAWSSAPTYNVGDNVYYSGTPAWYRCRIANTNQTPSGSSVYWSNAPALPQEWDAMRRYSQYDTARYNGIWYMCLSANSNNNPSVSSSAYWVGADTTAASYLWDASTAYTVGAVKAYGGVWYYCTTANTGYSPNNTGYWTPTWTQGSGAVTGAPVIYAQATVNFPDGSRSVTQYRAAINRSPLFPNALAATTTLALSGSSTNIASYDSATDPTAATQGYAAVLAAGSSSSAGTTSLLTLSSTATTVKGYLAAQNLSTGYTPRVTYTAGAVLQQANGTVTTPSATAINVDLTRISGSPYIPQYSIQTVPAYTTIANVDSSTVLGTPGGVTPQAITRAGSLTLDDSDDVITIAGPVVLDVQGDLQITGSSSAKIVIAETGSLRIHVSGRLRLDSSGGGIDNQTRDPKKCLILSSATTGDHNFSTTQAFHGAIYMPNEDLTIDATTATIYGAISARAISVTGDIVLRYDISLRGAIFGGVDEPWAVTSWRELTGSNNVATMP